MEPNVDRGMWAIIVLLIAVVLGGAVITLFPAFVGNVVDEMTSLMDDPLKIVAKGNLDDTLVGKEEELISFASDDDFEWVEDSFGYSVPSKGSSTGYYKYMGAEKEVHVPHTINGDPMTSYYSMFEGSEVTKVVSSNPRVTNMASMFYGSKASSLDLSSFDTSEVTSMSWMFSGSVSTSLDLSSFDTSKVTNMANMFYGSASTSLDLSSFDTSKVTDMAGMFRDSAATSLDLSSFDTSKVTDMAGMFRDSAATSLDLSNFDTSEVAYIRHMFSGSKAVEGYALSEADALNFNNSSDKPGSLVFIVK